VARVRERKRERERGCVYFCVHRVDARGRAGEGGARCARGDNEIGASVHLRCHSAAARARRHYIYIRGGHGCRIYRALRLAHFAYNLSITAARPPRRHCAPRRSRRAAAEFLRRGRGAVDALHDSRLTPRSHCESARSGKRAFACARASREGTLRDPQRPLHRSSNSDDRWR